MLYSTTCEYLEHAWNGDIVSVCMAVPRSDQKLLELLLFIRHGPGRVEHVT